MNTILDDFDIFATTYKEQEKEFIEDPLELAVALKNLTDNKPGVFYQLDDHEVRRNIDASVKEQAEKIRKYYGRKFFWTNLNNARDLSGFRSRVCYLLENRIRVCKDRDAGIYYKLPYFYAEDMIYDDFKKQYNTTDVPRILRGGFSKPAKQRLTLTYLKTTSCRQQKRNLNRFWFTDNTYLYNIEVANDNPLLEMFKQLVIEKMTVTFETFYNTDRIDQMYFYKLYNFSLAKEQNEVS
jgi:hypothetical protein